MSAAYTWQVSLFIHPYFIVRLLPRVLFATVSFVTFIELDAQGISATLPTIVPIDSAQSDSHCTADEAMLKASNGSGRSGHHERPRDVLKGPDSLLFAMRRRPVPVNVHGNIELGAIHGALPFTLPSASRNNAFARGQISLGNKAFPIGLAFDLGTDQPVRGQRNSLRFHFDAPTKLEAERWEQAHQLHHAHQSLDSLKALQALNRRRIAGIEAKIRAHEQRPLHQRPESAIATHDAADHVARPLAQNTTGESLLNVDVPRTGELDSLLNALPGLEQQQSYLDSSVLKQEGIVQRAQGMTALSNEKRGRLQELAQGIRRLEVGSCSPSSSEFLLNGLNFQGVSFEYARKDLFVAFDHGRSFDDTWMNNDPILQRLRQLHQSLFLQDAQELSPKRISVLRTGMGMIEGSHAHIGFLRGVRGDVPAGQLGVNAPQLELTNQVIEVDLAHVFIKRHTLQLISARSITSGGLGTDDPGDRDAPSLGDLFNERSNNNEALKAKWSSDLIKTGTRLSGELRSIDAQFHSFGVGFIRNGSRAWEFAIDQRMNARLRLRGRAMTEERRAPSNDGSDSSFLIKRASVSAQWNVSEALRLRGMFSPSVIVPHTPMTVTTTTTNNVLSGGASWRKRWKKTTITADVDASGYRWKQAGTVAQAMNIMMGTGLIHAERFTARYTVSAIGRLGSDTLPTVVNNTLSVGYSSRKGLKMDASGQVANDGAFGWRLNLQQPVTERTSIRLEGNRMSHFSNYLSTIDGFERNEMYTWTMAIQYFW